MRILYKIANKLFRIVKKILKLLTSRMVIIGVALLLEFCWLAGIMMQLNEKSVYINYAVTILSLIAVLSIINNPKMNPGYKLMWAVCILALPVTGICLYGILGHSSVARKFRTHYDTVLLSQGGVLGEEEETRKKLEEENILAAGQSSYLTNYAHYPVYENTETEYYPLGDVWFEHFIEELKKAEHYIFMEYFILKEGYMWEKILEILERKAQAGVEVRVMYDGTCAMFDLPYRYPEELKAKGMQCKMFAPIRPILSTHYNNRDHRKILVIDGKVGFTGGVNIGDEYINRVEKHGHWKDTAVMLKGDAVQGLTMMFLQMWNVTEKEPEYGKYLQKAEKASQAKGFVLPYGDSPFDDEPVGETVYMDILNRAKKYVHIMTPYLIIDQSMITALTFAAKRGVDVKLILPHIPDKKFVFALAKSHYKELLKAGVRIYEYTPGFVHAKIFTSDDEKAVVGTINLDYRSLYLHFECAAFLYQVEEIAEIEKDFQRTLEKCQEVTLENRKKGTFFLRLEGWLLKWLAPLM